MNKIIHWLVSVLLFGVGMLLAGIVMAEVSLDEAARQVSQKQQRVLGAKTVGKDGQKIHVIKVLTSEGRVKQIKVNAQTGQIVETHR